MRRPFQRRENTGMRLHDALRKAVREYGVRVIAEKRLLYILSDFRAFEEYPAMRQVLGSIAEEEYGKELVRLFLDDETDWCLSYAQNLRKSLSEKKRFREDLATYAVDSILFGLGLVNSVTEPSEHGFDPIDHSGAAGNGGVGTGARQPGAPQTGGAQAPGTAGQGSGAAPGGGAAPAGNAGANGPSSYMKWLAAAALLVGIFVLGWHAGSPSSQHEQAAVPRTADSRETAQDAERKSAQYEYEQGEKYYYGRGVSQNYAEALEWYRKAAEKWHTGAEISLGWMYEYGQGVSRDYQMALSWYLKAAAQGNNDAQRGIERVEKLISAQAVGNTRRKPQGDAADDDPGGVSVFGRKVYLRGEMDDCPWKKLYDKCLIRKVGHRVYKATAYMKADWAPYRFRFSDAKWTLGTNFGYARESYPGVYDYEKGTPIRLNPKSDYMGVEEIKVTPPHDGDYDFFLDISGDVPVTYVMEHR